MSERGAASGGWARRLFTTILLAAGGLLLATLGFFFFRDNFSTHYPMKVVSAAAWRAGTIPWWNATDAGGQPLAGNPNALTFYPDNILYLLLPPHVAFNLHFLLHLLLGWIAMRALIREEIGAPASCRPARRQDAAENQGRHAAAQPAAWKAALLDVDGPTFGAWLWVSSGAAVSALAFYNLITAIALIPFALLAARHRSSLIYGAAFGLLILGTEPVTLVATALAVAVVASRKLDRTTFLTFMPRSAIAIAVAAVIALPQIIAYSEITKEVERAHGYSAQTVLNASLDPRRLLELLIGPFLHIDASHLFPSLLIGIIAIPALARRSRWSVVAAVSLFFALGRFNPLVRLVIEAIPPLRSARYPEKFALPLCAAVAVLAAMFYERTSRKTLWAVVTFVPLAAWAFATVPIDWWSPYDLPAHAPERIYVAPSPAGQVMNNRSGDGMHSTLSRIVAERWAATHDHHYRAISLELPMAMIVPRVIGVASINEAVRTLESPSFDERLLAVAPTALNGFVSDRSTRVTSYRELADGIEIGVDAPGDALLFVNQSYFTAWDTGGSLRTVPLDIDRLGVIVRAGTKIVTLRFGRHRTAVLAAWVISSAFLLAALLALRIEERNRGTGEVEGPTDEDRAG